jgi:hypothetical protein
MFLVFITVFSKENGVPIQEKVTPEVRSSKFLNNYN